MGCDTSQYEHGAITVTQRSSFENIFDSCLCILNNPDSSLGIWTTPQELHHCRSLIGKHSYIDLMSQPVVFSTKVTWRQWSMRSCFTILNISVPYYDLKINIVPVLVTCHQNPKITSAWKRPQMLQCRNQQREGPAGRLFSFDGRAIIRTLSTGANGKFVVSREAAELPNYFWWPTLYVRSRTSNSCFLTSPFSWLVDVCRLSGCA